MVQMGFGKVEHALCLRKEKNSKPPLAAVVYKHIDHVQN